MAPLGVVVREWGRIGCLGFGGPPAHIALLRELCVERRAYLTDGEFEDAVAACNLLPGPASTQLAIFSAWRVAGGRDRRSVRGTWPRGAGGRRGSTAGGRRRRTAEARRRPSARGPRRRTAGGRRRRTARGGRPRTARGRRRSSARGQRGRPA